MLFRNTFLLSWESYETESHGVAKIKTIWILEQLVRIVSCRPAAKRGLCKQRTFLGNGSLNTYPQQRMSMQQ
jgi:hypothetical protein